MDIYLVRVNERPDKSLFIERKLKATTCDDYIAISHVWGAPETIQPTHVDGIGTVQLSPGKKDILPLLRRTDVCGDGWFWMDLFCIDQTETATISIADQLMAIPSIYKSSRCVKVLIESPVCEAWQAIATRVIGDQAVDQELFGEEEMRHGRKCSHFLFYDLWFERLWTRQEGLYGLVLDVVVLNPVPCARPQVGAQDVRTGWIAEGGALAKRTTAEFFLFDKLTYHGKSQSDAEKIQFQLYLDFVYRRRVDIRNYGGLVGPAPSYSPLTEAWRSGRSTTKPRDYVLAVFPDLVGYRVPPDARELRFHELLANALDQAAIQERFYIAAKVPKGLMLETSSRASVDPWIPQEPISVGEAYDTLIGRLLDKPKSPSDAKFFAVAKNIKLQVLDLSRQQISEVRDLWATTADTIQHMTHVSLSGPCTGTSRQNVQADHGLLHLYFFEQFASTAVAQYLPISRLDSLQLASTGAVDFNEIQQVPDDLFKMELRRFLVCLLCGTSLHTADRILESADFRVVVTEHGRLLALVRRDVLSEIQLADLMLVGTGRWHLQGFLVGLLTAGSCFMIGRTAIPTSQFWDAVEGGLGNS